MAEGQLRQDEGTQFRLNTTLRIILWLFR